MGPLPTTPHPRFINGECLDTEPNSNDNVIVAKSAPEESTGSESSVCRKCNKETCDGPGDKCRFCFKYLKWHSRKEPCDYCSSDAVDNDIVAKSAPEESTGSEPSVCRKCTKGNCEACEVDCTCESECCGTCYKPAHKGPCNSSRRRLPDAVNNVENTLSTTAEPSQPDAVDQGFWGKVKGAKAQAADWVKKAYADAKQDLAKTAAEAKQAIANAKEGLADATEGVRQWISEKGTQVENCAKRNYYDFIDSGFGRRLGDQPDAVDNAVKAAPESLTAV